MYSTYKLNADELTNDILNSIKSAYQHKEIEIIVQDIQDETEYLLSTEANKEHLLKSIKEISNKDNLVSVKLEEL